MFENLPAESPAEYDGWKQIVAKYTRSDTRKSVWQLINSFGGLFICWALMYWSFVNVGYWLTLLISLPAAGFVVRIFIIQHDAGHGSFFSSRKANDWTGFVCSMVTMIAYRYWRKNHAIHHAHHAELEERGIGDVWTLTVDEYLAAPTWKKVVYRAFRHPLFLFGVAPFFGFVVLQRFPLSTRPEWKEERRSVWVTNVALLVLYTALVLIFGFWTVVLIQLPIVLISGSMGHWLFYVQHQFERTYWEHTPEWNYTLAAMHGSSYYELPKVLQWFTGNIGFHHIHHLSPRIPNYNLERCHAENPLMQRVVKLTVRSSLRTVNLSLWDEQRQRLVTFREALQAQVARARAQQPAISKAG